CPVLDVHKTLCSDLWALHILRQFIDLFSGIISAPLGTNAHNKFSSLEYWKSPAFAFTGNINKFHPESCIGFVRTVFAHSLLVRNPRKFGKVYSLDCFEEMSDQSFEK